MNLERVDLSVIIGFKDWGVERLLLSIKSILESFGTKHGEVIVSDYGSDTFAPGELEQMIEAAGAVYVRTETDGTWSRSRAVNAGYSAARGEVVVATDADMLFTPNSMEAIAGEVLADPGSAVVLQCRDLPEGYDHIHLTSNELNFEELHRVSQIRPRWGMGGMFAAHRNVIASVGGYDNRMHTYGGEDLDLAVRVRRSGHRVRWIENNRVRMYHIWHEPTIKSVEENEDAKNAVAANRAILKNDRTWKRNVADNDLSAYQVPWALKAVATFNPGSRFLGSIDASFVLLSPVPFDERDDLEALVSKQLNSANRALVGQVAAFKTPASRTTPVWETDFRFPLLAFDAKFLPIVEDYFRNGTWDILGAARRLQAAKVKIDASSEIFGIVPNTPENSRLSQKQAWEWDAAPGLYPKPPGPWAISELVSNLSVGIVSKIVPALDLRVSSHSINSIVEVEPLSQMATQWTFVEDLVSNKAEFDAVLLNVSEAQVVELCEMAKSIQAKVTPISFSSALETIEHLSGSNLLAHHAETIRSRREDQSGAVQIAWLENRVDNDTQSVTETKRIGGDLIDIYSDEYCARLWVAPGPVIDVKGDFVNDLKISDISEEWSTGLIGPIPIEALVSLGERL